MPTSNVDLLVAQIRSRADTLLRADTLRGDARPRDYYLDMALAEIEIGNPRLQPSPQLRGDSYISGEIRQFTHVIPFKR